MLVDALLIYDGEVHIYFDGGALAHFDEVAIVYFDEALTRHAGAFVYFG